MSGISVRRVVVCAAVVVLLGMSAARPMTMAQSGTVVDFRRDVQPLFAAHCAGCHGPNQQMGGLRVDRRASVLNIAQRRVVPGSTIYSLLYQRLASNQFGPQMPPTGALTPDQIGLVKSWIEQGAGWPDDLANDEASSPPDPSVTRAIDALRQGDRAAVPRQLTASPPVVNAKGPDGSTLLMHAALYGDAENVSLLLDRGADPNVTNAAGGTALMWAVHDPTTTGVLLDRGATVDARTPQGQTALSLAAGQAGSAAVVSMLLARGAEPTGAALVAAANANDAEVFQLLVAKGGDVKGAVSRILPAALRAGCVACVDQMLGLASPAALNAALVMLAPFGHERDLRRLLDRGADANAVLTNARSDFAGRTPLMLAAASDFLPVDAIRVLIARGADVNAKGPVGETALDLARRNGRTPVVDLLLASGAKESGVFRSPEVVPERAASIPAAIARALPMLQRADVEFVKTTGCVSCHHNTMTAMAVSAVRAKQLPVNEAIAAEQRQAIAKLLDSKRDTMRLGGNSIVTNAATNILVGLAAEDYPADDATAAAAQLLASRQLADGRWRNAFVDHRPPIQGSDVEATATAVRALHVYAPAPQRARYRAAVDRAASWLAHVSPRTTDERAMQLLGLMWAGVSSTDANLRHAARQLLAEQRSDGGWAQLPTLASDAYATGQALYALQTARGVNARDAAYRRAVEYLMRTQLKDGSWYVKSRSIPFQPYFESGFPHGPDQWVSMAATNWAVMALANATWTGGTSRRPGAAAAAADVEIAPFAREALVNPNSDAHAYQDDERRHRQVVQ